MSNPVANTKATLKGMSVLLYGDAGTGKTTSIWSMVEAGIEVFYVGVEPGLESLISYWVDKNQPIPANLHWYVVPASEAGFKEMLDASTNVTNLPQEALHKLPDANKSKHNRFVKVLQCFNNFVDDRTKQSFGSVGGWGVERAVVVDSLTSLNACAMAMVSGSKAVHSQADWGIAQTSIERFVRQITENCQCHVVFIAHAERDKDELTGATKIMPQCLGNKLLPKLTPMFSDIILATKEGKSFFWDTANPSAIAKFRYIGNESKMAPDFRPMLEKHKKRAAAMALIG